VGKNGVVRDASVHEEVLRQGLKITGATAYLVSETGGVGPILLQTAVPVKDDDDAVTLQRRVLTDAEWALVAEATKLWCSGKFELRGGRAKRKK
jgi:phosphoribosylglycinamide formyltransferase-1